MIRIRLDGGGGGGRQTMRCPGKDGPVGKEVK